MRILLLVAGTNDPSNSDYLADRFVEGMSTTGNVEINKIHLKDLHIDHFTLDHYKQETPQGEDYLKVEKALQESSGVVIASPIWNFGVPGHLKNLIDRMGRCCLDIESRSLGMLKGKPFFLLYTGGSPYPAWTGLQRRTVSHLPVSIRYFGGVVIGAHYEGRSTKGKGEFGLVVDQRPDSIAAVKEKGKHFAGIVRTFAETGKLPLRERFLVWVFKTAQKLKRKLGL